MRQGRTFKRCGKCNRRVTDRTCANCGYDGHSWAFTVDIGPRGGKRKQVSRSGFKTKREALAAMADLQDNAAKGTRVEPSKMTVGDYLDDWLNGVKGEIRGSTWKSADGHVRLHIKPRIGDVGLQVLTRNRVRALWRELRDTGLSPKSVHNVSVTLNSALNAAVEDQLIVSNPAARTSKAPKASRAKLRTWSAEQVRAFLAYVADDADLALWRVAAMTGMRRGEVLGLRWQDVDLDAARLSVRQTWGRSDSGLDFGEPKTARGRRTIDLDPHTVAILREHGTTQKRDRLAFGPGYEDHGLVFARPDGTPHDPDVVSQRFARLAEKAGLPVIRFHDLRHTHASILLAQGRPPKVRTAWPRLSELHDGRLPGGHPRHAGGRRRRVRGRGRRLVRECEVPVFVQVACPSRTRTRFGKVAQFTQQRCDVLEVEARDDVVDRPPLRKPDDLDPNGVAKAVDVDQASFIDGDRLGCGLTGEGDVEDVALIRVLVVHGLAPSITHRARLRL